MEKVITEITNKHGVVILKGNDPQKSIKLMDYKFFMDLGRNTHISSDKSSVYHLLFFTEYNGN